MYYLFRQLSTRAVLFDEVSTALEAQNYLQKFKNGFVVDDDDNVYKTALNDRRLFLLYIYRHFFRCKP